MLFSFVYNSQFFLLILFFTSNNIQNYMLSVSFFQGTVNIVFPYISAYFLHFFYKKTPLFRGFTDYKQRKY